MKGILALILMTIGSSAFAISLPSQQHQSIHNQVQQQLKKLNINGALHSVDSHYLERFGFVIARIDNNERFSCLRLQVRQNIDRNGRIRLTDARVLKTFKSCSEITPAKLSLWQSDGYTFNCGANGNSIGIHVSRKSYRVTELIYNYQKVENRISHNEDFNTKIVRDRKNDINVNIHRRFENGKAMFYVTTCYRNFDGPKPGSFTLEQYTCAPHPELSTSSDETDVSIWFQGAQDGYNRGCGHK